MGARDVVEIVAEPGEEAVAFLNRIWMGSMRAVGVHNGRRFHVTGNPFGDLVATFGEGEAFGRAAALSDFTKPGELTPAPIRAFDAIPPRTEIALRFAVAAYGGNLASPAEFGAIDADKLAAHAFLMADAFLAAAAAS